MIKKELELEKKNRNVESIETHKNLEN